MIIKDRLIEVDVIEALAIAGKGEKVCCVVDGTRFMGITDALEGLTFFAPESALTEEVEPIKIEASREEIAKLGSATLSPGPAHFDTPEARTRAIIDSVERYDEEHGDPPVARQDAEPPRAAKAPTKTEAPKAEEPKAEALTKEYSGEVPGFVPFAGAPSGGGCVEEMTSGKIKINGHNAKPTEPTKVPLTKADERKHLTIEWTDDMLGVLGAMRYTTAANGERTTQWSINRLRSYFEVTYDDIVHGLERYAMDEPKYNKAAEKFRLPAVSAGRAVWRTIKRKEAE